MCAEWEVAQRMYRAALDAAVQFATMREQRAATDVAHAAYSLARAEARARYVRAEAAIERAA